MANPPPPYADITGISRAVMKDNAQVTLANYNGNARPGELVVDQTTDQVYNGGASGLPVGFYQMAYNPTTGNIVYYT